MYRSMQFFNFLQWLFQEREYAEVKERVFSKYPTKFPVEKFSIELFLWSFIMLVSPLKVYVLTIFFIPLIPYCDICVSYIDLDTFFDPGNSYLSYFIASYFILSYLILYKIIVWHSCIIFFYFNRRIDSSWLVAVLRFKFINRPRDWEILQ